MALIETLTAQVAEVEHLRATVVRQGRNSKNSSLPPSSDRFFGTAKRPPRGSGRKPGKQPGARRGSADEQ